MKHSAEKNFHIFISLFLGGIGVGLVLLPSHLAVTSSLTSSLLHVVSGLICFFTALALQIHTAWELSSRKVFIIRGFALILLFVIGWMLIMGEQWVGAVTLFTAGLVQFVSLLPLGDEFRRGGLYPLAVGLVTLTAGIVLPVTGYDAPTPIIPLLAVLFLISAFLAGVAATQPNLRYAKALFQVQLIPWAGLFVLNAVTQQDNLVTPTAMLAILTLERFIPWERLNVPEDDILSRRVLMISLFAEMAHLIFLGALLFIIDPTFANESITFLTAREATLIFFILFSVMVYYIATTVMMTTNGLIQELSRSTEETEEAEQEHPERWTRRLERYLRPFIMSPEGVRGRIQAEQIARLTRQTGNEKKRNAQLTLLLELSQQLENQLDQPVSAQLAVNTLERALNCATALIFIHEPERHDFMLIASAGRQLDLVPTGYRQDSSTGVIGRALRQRKTQIVNDTRIDPDYIAFKNKINLSAVIIPLISNGHVNGMITLSNEKANAFGALEIGLAEAVAAELTRAWDRSGYHQRLTEVVQTGSQLFSAPDPGTTAQEVASISRTILQAKFTYVYIQLGQERNFIQHAFSGTAPFLRDSLRDTVQTEKLIQTALHASQPFRIRDARKYDKTANLALDNAGLRSLLIIPIRWHPINIGAIFAFGKQNEVFFNENDESLAELIAIQASGAFESAWLQQELRASVRITSLLYRLSTQIIQAENIDDAISDIAHTAHKLDRNTVTGIVLFNEDDEILAQVCIDEYGKRENSEHPLSLIRNAMESRQLISFSPREAVLRTCLPIQTPIRTYGAIWMDAPDDPDKPSANPKDLQDLVSQAALALERSLLLVESRRQATEIKAAYDMLEATYDQTLASLTSALDARDRETEGHSMRVTHLAVKLGQALGYSTEQLKVLERGAWLHDIGKIGISDSILHKPGPLTEEEWKIMKLHPDIGARIVAGIPFLEDTIQLIRHHQERWDGSGYPNGLKGENIPELARLFSVIDAFDALTSNRPYRKKITGNEAMSYLKEMAGILFDPAMVSAFETLLQKEPRLQTLQES